MFRTIFLKKNSRGKLIIPISQYVIRQRYIDHTDERARLNPTGGPRSRIQSLVSHLPSFNRRRSFDNSLLQSSPQGVVPTLSRASSTSVLQEAPPLKKIKI
ncbi:MAG: hypothetical protein ACI9S8_001260 [Chlamydiales bacterium]|jgi:hypothetical protein